jgi:hypothetical protein
MAAVPLRIIRDQSAARAMFLPKKILADLLLPGSLGRSRKAPREYLGQFHNDLKE